MNILRLSTLSLTLAIAVITLSYVNVASAKPMCPGDHPSCKDAGDDGYSVDFVGSVAGESADHWLGGFGGKNSIGLNDAGVNENVGEFTHLNFFTLGLSLFGDDGIKCFGSSSRIHQAIIKRGKGGRAEASFWFHGLTTDEREVGYSLHLFGLFYDEAGEVDPTVDFPPVGGTQEIIMTDWKTGVSNKGKEIKSYSCIDEGEMEIVVTMIVTKET